MYSSLAAILEVADNLPDAPHRSDQTNYTLDVADDGSTEGNGTSNQRGEDEFE